MSDGDRVHHMRANCRFRSQSKWRVGRMGIWDFAGTVPKSFDNTARARNHTRNCTRSIRTAVPVAGLLLQFARVH
eukprot:scaffold139883_cov18-Prasinocladus_malaysianus.AAC.1